MALSHRGQEGAKPDPAFRLWTILDDLWDSVNNPGGYVSLGVAENALMHQELLEHIHQNLALSKHALTYGDGPRGSKRLKRAMSKFLTRHLKPNFPIEPSHVTITNGCSAVIEHLAWSLANPGDVFLLGRPHYGAFSHNLTLRSSAELVKVAFGDVDPMSLEAVQAYKQQVLVSQSKGKKVAGIVICHPHNPLGRCFPIEALKALMELCQEHQIHLVSDEIYALSVFNPEVAQTQGPAPQAFSSVLSVATDDLIDPNLVHSIWGMSKDFGANGIRVGVLISRNLELHASLVPVALYSCSSSIADHATCNLLEDEAWTDAYIKESQRRLAEHHAITVDWAERHQIAYARGVNAAFFLWVDLGHAYRQRHSNTTIADADITEVVTESLLKHRVFLASGQQFGSEIPGWFRIVFSNDKVILEEGLKRVLVALE